MGKRQRKGKAKQSQMKRVRLHLIDIFSRNLAIYYPDAPRAFICPLCRRFARFDKPEDIDHLVSFAHIFPEAVGGKQGVLTCKGCNSGLGSRIDSHLKDEQNFHRWAAGDLALDGRMIVGEANLGVSATLKEGKRWELRVIRKATHDKQLKRAHEHIASKGGEDTVTVRLPYFNAQGRNAALMHTAFLSLFATFGYEYAMSPNADRVRDVLSKEDITSPIFKQAIVVTPDSAQHPPVGGISMLVKPEEYRCLLVPIPSWTKSKKRYIVAMPGFASGDHTSFNCFLQRRETEIDGGLAVANCPG